MNKDDLKLEDDLRSEYDLTNLKVRKMGAGRKSFAGTTVRLEPDVAEMFPNADAVNEANKQEWSTALKAFAQNQRQYNPILNR